MEHESNGVRLKITSKVLTAADIEARLGLKPDESWKIGETTGAFGVVLKDHGYAIDSTASLKAPISEHLRSVIKRIAPVAKQIGEVSTQATVEMICRGLQSHAPAHIRPRRPALAGRHRRAP